MAVIATAALCLAASIPVFTPGEAGSRAFRIPGMLSFSAGSHDVLLAYAEGRVQGCGDFSGTHTVVLKRSLDGGHTWGGLSTVLDPMTLLGPDACPLVNQSGCEFWDPTAVFDEKTGAVIMLAALSLKTNDRMSGKMTVWQITSKDLGASWGAPENITAGATSPALGTFTPGNGHATQLASGRLLFAGYLRPAGDTSESCATLASDDHGASWALQPPAPFVNGTSECEVVEVGEGASLHIYMDERMNSKAQAARGGCGEGVPNCRWRSTSADGGVSWQGPTPVPALPDPTNAAGIAAWRTRGPDALIFSNTRSTSARVNVTLRVSLDGGASWPPQYAQLVSATGGYSDVQLVPGRGGAPDHAAVLHETAGACGPIELGLVDLHALVPPAH